MADTDQWTTTCPNCKADGELRVISGTFSCVGTHLYPNGFEIDEHGVATDNEVVECASCHSRFSLSELELCEACGSTGILDPSSAPGHIFGSSIPKGWHLVERCDACRKFPNDHEAAARYYRTIDAIGDDDGDPNPHHTIVKDDSKWETDEKCEDCSKPRSEVEDKS